MEQMPYVPYLPPEESGWKRHLEGAIPIILLLIVFLVIGWKMNWLAGIPFIGSLFKSNINVLILGTDPTLERTLDQLKGDLPINTLFLDKATIGVIQDPEYLKKYDIVILSEGDGTTVDLPYLMISHLSNYMKGGGNLILYGRAGSLVTGDPNANGWETAGLGEFVPVRCTNGPKPDVCGPDSTTGVSASKVVMLPKRMEHPIMKGQALSVEFCTAGSAECAQAVSYTTTNPRGDEIAALRVSLINTVSEPAIVESKSLLGGKTIYFSYHPSKLPALLRNAIAYMVGKG